MMKNGKSDLSDVEKALIGTTANVLTRTSDLGEGTVRYIAYHVRSRNPLSGGMRLYLVDVGGRLLPCYPCGGEMHFYDFSDAPSAELIARAERAGPGRKGRAGGATLEVLA